MVLERRDENLARGAILRTELESLTEEAAEMKKWREYYEGEQPLTYSTDTFVDVFGDVFEGFKDNWMKVIVKARVNRLKITGFNIDLTPDNVTATAEADDAAEDEPESMSEQELANRIWRVLWLNDIDWAQRELYRSAMVESRAFMIVWPDTELGATVDWNPGSLCRVFYDPDRRNRALWAVKRWNSGDGDVYTTFYTPNFVYKYIERNADINAQRDRDATKDKMTMVPTIGYFATDLEERRVEGEPWPLPNPFGEVPVIEFDNTDSTSELDGHIEQQDALNKSLVDLMVTGSFQGFPQRIIETLSREPEGGWVAGPGEVWHLTPSVDAEGNAQESKWDSFEVASPNGVIEIVNMFLQHIALTSDTPVRYFMQSDRGGRGDAPSGEALLVDDKPLNDSVFEKQDRWNSSWSAVARLIAKAIDAIGDDDLLVARPQWQDPRHDYRLLKLEEAKTMAEAGFPVKFIATQIGLTTREVSNLLAAIDEDREFQAQRGDAANAIANASSSDDNDPEA